MPPSLFSNSSLCQGLCCEKYDSLASWGNSGPPGCAYACLGLTPQYQGLAQMSAAVLTYTPDMQDGYQSDLYWTMQAQSLSFE
jgi:hypothetical protein